MPYDPLTFGEDASCWIESPLENSPEIRELENEILEYPQRSGALISEMTKTSTTLFVRGRRCTYQDCLTAMPFKALIKERMGVALAKIKIYKNIDELLTLEKAMAKQGRCVNEKDLTIRKNAALIVEKGRVLWVGRTADLRSAKIRSLLKGKSVQESDLSGLTVLPAFVECHTHSIFAGNRVDEFELRNQGVSYQEIAKRGGGILSTVKATRKASKKDLLVQSQKRVDRFVEQGVATLEVKSGYALNKVGELKMLEVAGQLQGPRIVRTFLGPHSIPKEFAGSSDYLEYILDKVLPTVVQKKLAERADIFVEEGYFSVEQGRKYLQACRKLGLHGTIHADQLTNNHGAVLGVETGCDSVDHLVQLNQREIQQIAQSSTTAVLLPTADFYLKMDYPKARELIDAGARVALATDFNPGSSPTQSLSFVGILSRLEMKMTLPEVIAAYTVGASYALGLEKSVGCLKPGYSADFTVITGSWKELFYDSHFHPVDSVWKSGRRIFKNKNF